MTSGVLTVAAQSQGQDAAAVWYHDQYLPVYYELAGRIRITKPTGGWKGNAFAIFDYWARPTSSSPVSTTPPTSSSSDTATPAAGTRCGGARYPGGVKYDTWYDLLVAVNGTQVTVTVNGGSAVSYTFAPRVIDGDSYGLNKGLLGFGSDNSRGQFDNVQLRTLPAQLTLDRFENFSRRRRRLARTRGRHLDRCAPHATAVQCAAGPAPAGSPSSLVDLGKPIAYDSYLGLDADGPSRHRSARHRVRLLRATSTSSTSSSTSPPTWSCSATDLGAAWVVDQSVAFDAERQLATTRSASRSAAPRSASSSTARR